MLTPSPIVESHTSGMVKVWCNGVNRDPLYLPTEVARRFARDLMKECDRADSMPVMSPER